MPYQPGEIILEKYRIEALIGQGAFGEVYRVTHLGLHVPRAVKILRRDAPGVGSTEFNDFKSRFQFEAILGAQLNTPTPHPHLLQAFNYEEKGDILLLEMEYASGGSLANYLSVLKKRRKTLPPGFVVQMGMEVADGLAALHAMDIVHRDLKPSNILFDQNGHAKVADLGLAQAHDSNSLRSQISNPSPHPGTPAYMSPEQHDSRDYLPPASDVYALGMVLFEVLTGRMYLGQRPGTRAGELVQGVPGWLDDLLVCMLADDPKERPWNGQEIVSLLREGLEGETSKQKEAAARQEAQELELTRQKSDAEQKLRLEAKERLKEAEERELREQRNVEHRRLSAKAALNPDPRDDLAPKEANNRTFLIMGGIFAALIFLILICVVSYLVWHGLNPTAQPNTAQATNQAENAQFVQQLTTTAEAVLYTATMPHAQPNNAQATSATENAQFVQQLTTTAEAALFIPGITQVPTRTPTGTEIPTLVPSPTSTPIPTQYGAGGQIVFHSDRDKTGEIYLINPDGSGSLRLTSIINGVWNWYPIWSPDGTQIAYTCNQNGNSDICVANADGSNVVNLTNNPANDSRPSWSPDGQKIAFESARNGGWDIYVMNADGNDQTLLTTNPAYKNQTPDWSPDGSQIAFSSLRDGNWKIYVMNPDGSGVVKLTNDSYDDYHPAWSPDGEKIAYYSARGNNKNEIFLMNADGSGEVNLTSNPADDAHPTWSPDGRLIAFQSTRNGNSDIYVMKADGSDVIQITNNSAYDGEPAWYWPK